MSAPSELPVPHAPADEHAFARLEMRSDADGVARTGTLERISGVLSAACAVHCVLMPLLVAALPLLGSSGRLLNGASETLLSGLVLLSGSASLVLGYRRHRDVRIAATIFVCLALYTLGHAHEDAWYGVVLSVFSGLGLAAASFWSARRGHRHGTHCAHPEHSH